MMYVYKVHMYPSVQVEVIGNFRELFFSLHRVGSGFFLFLLGYVPQASSPVNFGHISASLYKRWDYRCMSPHLAILHRF